MKHLISIDDLTFDEIQRIFYLADYYKSKKYSNILEKKLLATFFYEPSTRTRLSFESAAYRLGMNILSVPDAEVSSHSKGESLEDTVKTVSELSDILILRHHLKGSAALAASVSKIPIINAGDGDGEHPSQALLDLYTISRQFDDFKNIKVTFFGDVEHARTCNSLIKLLKRYNIQTDSYVDEKSLINTSVLYIVRDQRERWGQIDPCGWGPTFNTIGPEELNYLPKTSLVMHPLPRNAEIDIAIDSDPRVVFFKQVNNGLFVRMALLDFMLSE